MKLSSVFSVLGIHWAFTKSMIYYAEGGIFLVNTSFVWNLTPYVPFMDIVERGIIELFKMYKPLLFG